MAGVSVGISGENAGGSTMCTRGQIIASLFVLSAMEVGIGVTSVVLGAVSIAKSRARQPQLGDSSPVWSGVCVRCKLFLLLDFLHCVWCSVSVKDFCFCILCGLDVGFGQVKGRRRFALFKRLPI